MLDKAYYVYIVASKTRRLYTGFTSKLSNRIWQHKTHIRKGFTDDYCCDRLVWTQMFDNPFDAIAREKQIKGWLRKRKLELIQEENPSWEDLAKDWFDAEDVQRARIANGDKRISPTQVQRECHPEGA